MAENQGIKSAYELAMERLRAEDKSSGAGPRKSLTEQQKKRIAELRQAAKSKLAELEILHQKNLEAVLDPEELQKIEEHFRVDCGRVDSSLESKIAAIKKES